jgi:type I restriction enzyme, S subunit
MSAAVRAGYKMTEVGVIPKDWEASTIGDNSKWMSGGTPRRTNTEFWRGDIPWISGSTLKLAEISTSDQFLTKEAVSIGSKMAPVESTLLLVRGSALHNEIRAGLVIAPVSFNQDVKALIPYETVEPKFLTYYILGQSDALLKLVSSAGNSAGVLDTKLVQGFKFFKPPIVEQRAIAAALSDVDALLAKQGQLIAKKQGLKQAAIQQLLTGQTRLPGFSGNWEMKRLNAIADIRSGGTPSTTRPEFWDGGVLWCTPTDITALSGRKYLYETSRSITAEGLKCSSAELIPAGSIVMTSRATIGECAINSVPVTTNQGFKNFVPFSTTDADFLYYLLQTKKQDFIGLCSGSTFLEIGKTQLIAFEVKIPATKTEQTAIATILSDMDTEIAALEERQTKTRALKQGMMQELLTGKTRLV